MNCLYRFLFVVFPAQQGPGRGDQDASLVSKMVGEMHARMTDLRKDIAG